MQFVVVSSEEQKGDFIFFNLYRWICIVGGAEGIDCL